MPVPDTEWPVPEHQHKWDWITSDAYEGPAVEGLWCRFTYEIPPGPRGKRPRKRNCPETADMEEVQAVFAKAVGGSVWTEPEPAHVAVAAPRKPSAVDLYLGRAS